MAGYRWIQLFFILMSGLQFTGASVFIQRGDDVTLPCENVINNQDKCDGTTWLFSDSRNPAALSLFEYGQIRENTKSKSDRLSVTEKCSLVIKKVTDVDVGRYTCRQFISGRQQQGDTVAELSVVTMTQHKNIDVVTLNCFVSTHERCGQTVKWLFDGKDVKNDQTKITSQSPCNTTVIFVTSLDLYSSRFELFKCEVTDGIRSQQFTFSPQPPGEKPGDKTTKATTVTTVTTDFSATNIETDAVTAASPTNPKTLEDMWWLFLIVALVLVALLILAVIAWKRTQGNKSRMNDKVESTSKPAVSRPAPEPIYNTVEPEDGVSYASVSFKKKTNSEARLHTKKDEDDESDSVTYITVKASSSEPSDLYAAIRKPKNLKSV